MSPPPGGDGAPDGSKGHKRLDDPEIRPVKDAELRPVRPPESGATVDVLVKTFVH